MHSVNYDIHHRGRVRDLRRALIFIRDRRPFLFQDGETPFEKGKVRCARETRIKDVVRDRFITWMIPGARSVFYLDKFGDLGYYKRYEFG